MNKMTKEFERYWAKTRIYELTSSYELLVCKLYAWRAWQAAKRRSPKPVRINWE